MYVYGNKTDWLWNIDLSQPMLKRRYFPTNIYRQICIHLCTSNAMLQSWIIKPIHIFRYSHQSQIWRQILIHIMILIQANMPYDG